MVCQGACADALNSNATPPCKRSLFECDGPPPLAQDVMQGGNRMGLPQGVSQMQGLARAGSRAGGHIHTCRCDFYTEEDGTWTYDRAAFRL